MYDESEIFNQTNSTALKSSPGRKVDSWLYDHWMQGYVRIDEDIDVDLYTYHFPRALIIPMNQSHITEVPIPLSWCEGCFYSPYSWVTSNNLSSQTDPMGPRIAPILSGQGHIQLLTLWVSLTQRESQTIWTISCDNWKVGPLCSIAHIVSHSCFVEKFKISKINGKTILTLVRPSRAPERKS